MARDSNIGGVIHEDKVEHEKSLVLEVEHDDFSSSLF